MLMSAGTTLLVPTDLDVLPEGTEVHVEALDLAWRRGVVVRAYPGETCGGWGVLHLVQLEGDGSGAGPSLACAPRIRVSRSMLCPIFALPVTERCRGWWDFHPPLPRLAS